MNSSAALTNVSHHVPGIPLNVTLHSWAVPNLQDRQAGHQNTQNATRNSWTPHDVRQNVTSQNLNATGYTAIEEDAGLTDLETLMLAGISTLLPLVLTLIAGYVIRYLYTRYKDVKTEGYQGVLTREESSDPLGKNPGTVTAQEVKTSESEFTVTPGDEPITTPSPKVLTPKSNGSVITMTLKNNHLIVETEETTNEPVNGTKIESQGTITKYVTTTSVPDFIAKTNVPVAVDQQQSNNHGALVHPPPRDILEESAVLANTGLSQSDLSVSSSGSHNPSYRYGNQSEYNSGGYGYQEDVGYLQTEMDSNTKLKGPHEPKSITRIMLERGDSIMSNIEINSPLLADVLLSDVEARDRILHPKEMTRIPIEEEPIQLGNGEASIQDGDEASSKCQPLKNEKSPVEAIERLS